MRARQRRHDHCSVVFFDCFRLFRLTLLPRLQFLFAFGNVDLQEATYGIGLAEEEDALLSGEDFCNSICKNEEAGIDATQQARYAAYLQVAPPEIAELAVNGAVETLYDIFEHWEKTGLDVADFFEVSPRGVQQAIAAAEPKQVRSCARCS